MSDKSFETVLIETNKDLITQFQRFIEQKGNIIKIVIDDISDEDKLSQIRQSMLKFGLTPKSKSMDNFLNEFNKGINGNLDFKELTHRTKMLNTTLDSYIERMAPYGKLFEEIGDILRQKEKNPKEKVNEISDLLV